MPEADGTIRGRGPIALMREKGLSYGNPEDLEPVMKLDKTGPGEWKGRVWDTEMPDARCIKLTKQGVELTNTSESWELKTLFDPQGKPKTVVLSSQFFEKPVKIDLDEERARLDSFLTGLERGLGITRKGILQGDADVSINYSKGRINVGNDEAEIETCTENTKPKNGRRYGITVMRRYGEDFSLETVCIMCGAFKEGNPHADIPQEAANMPRFLNLPGVKKEVERLRLLQR